MLLLLQSQKARAYLRLHVHYRNFTADSKYRVLGPRGIGHLLLLVNRDDVENSQMEKRALKHDLESKIETVRNFWRNKIVEGSSQSGRILRAALIRP